MSQPAVYVLIQNGQTRLCFPRGFEIDQVTAMGPDVTLAYLASYFDGLEADDLDLGDFDYGEGALIDVDHKMLLVNSEQLDMARRLVFLAGILRTWAGWHVRWAYRGWDDFAGYAGLPRPSDSSTAWAPDPDEKLWEHDSYPAVMTIDDGQRVRVVGLDYEMLYAGPSLLNAVPTDDRCYPIEVPPTFGIHIDIPAKRAGHWTTEGYRYVESAWRARWGAEWELDLWEDRFEDQITRARGALAAPALDLDAARLKYANRLCFHWFVSLAENVANPGHAHYFEEARKPMRWHYIAHQVSVGLTEARYRDLLEVITGHREASEEAAWREALTSE